MAILITKYKTGVDFPPLTTSLNHLSGENSLTFPYKSGDGQHNFSEDTGVHLLLVNGGSLILTDDTDTFSVSFGGVFITVTWHSRTSSLADTDDVVFVFNAFAKPTSGLTRLKYVAASGQTVFQGLDTGGTALTLTNSNIQVFKNDNFLEDTDYGINTTDNILTLVPAAAAALNDIITIFTYESVGDIGPLNDATISATTSATTASNHKTTAQRWATNPANSSVVDVQTGTNSNDYSAKAYAIGNNQLGGSAKEWAIGGSGILTNPVEGSHYSAKYYAVQGNVATVATNMSNIQNVSTNISNINAVHSSLSNISAVASVVNNNTLQTVLNDIAAIKTTADDLNEATSEIDTVANSITNVDLVGTNIGNVNLVGPAISDINNIQPHVVNIATVAGQISPTNNIVTVANSITNVNTVAGLSTAIGTVNSNSTNINTVANANTNITSVAGSIANVNTVASNVTGVNSFAERYRVGSSDPTSSNDEGDLFYNSTSNTVRFYNGSAWVAIEASTSTTINNNADNRIITGSGTSNTLEGEANLTYDGTSLLVGNDGVIKFDPTDSNVASNVIIGQPRPANMTAGVNRNVTIIGKDNLTPLTTGVQNVVMGYGNATSLTTGGNNFIIGYQNMRGSNGTDTNNVMIGYQNFHSASYRSTSNVFIGSYNNYGAADDHDYPENNVGIGRSNLYNNQENYNVAVGFANIQQNDYNGTGYNVGMGTQNLASVHRGRFNVAIGMQNQNVVSGTSTPHEYNTTIGYQNMRLGEGNYNVGIGYRCLENSSSGSNYNVAIGYECMENSNNDFTDENVAIGRRAGENLSGNRNICIGANSGQSLNTGSNMITLGRFNGYDSEMDVRQSSQCFVVSTDTKKVCTIMGSATTAIGNPTDHFPNKTHFTEDTTNFTGVTHLTFNASGQDHYRFFNANGDVGSISTSGTATTYSTSSDHRLKENVNYTFDATARLKQLKPARFNFIADGSDNTVDGFLAHEVMSIVPEAITGNHNGTKEEEYVKTPAVYKDVVIPEELDEDGEVQREERTVPTVVTEEVLATRTVPDYQKIDQSKLVPLLTKTILELEARITALENA